MPIFLRHTYVNFSSTHICKFIIVIHMQIYYRHKYANLSSAHICKFIIVRHMQIYHRHLYANLSSSHICKFIIYNVGSTDIHIDIKIWWMLSSENKYRVFQRIYSNNYFFPIVVDFRKVSMKEKTEKYSPKWFCLYSSTDRHDIKSWSNLYFTCWTNLVYKNYLQKNKRFHKDREQLETSKIF